MYVSLTVTVHENTLGGRRDMAVSLEEALRRREQRLNATERVRELYSQANPFAEERDSIACDDLLESGVFLVDGEKGANPFHWHKHRSGPVAVAATVRVGAGRTEEEQDAVAVQVIKGVALVATEVTGRPRPETRRRTAPARRMGPVTRRTGPVRIAPVYGKLYGETALEEVAADEEFTDVTQRVAERPEDAVLFAGLRPERAASPARALRSTGHRGVRVTGEHVLGDRFLAEAEGWLVSAGWTDADADPLTKAFAASYRRRHRRTPAPWAAEAYDAVRFAAHGRPPPTATAEAGPLCGRNCCAVHGRGSPAESPSTPTAASSKRTTTAALSFTASPADPPASWPAGTTWARKPEGRPEGPSPPSAAASHPPCRPHPPDR